MKNHKSKSKINRLAQLYSDQKSLQIYKSSLKQMGKLKRPFLYERNQFMSQSILQHIDESKIVFATAGVAHLHGNKGILKSLKKAGLNIKGIYL